MNKLVKKIIDQLTLIKGRRSTSTFKDTLALERRQLTKTRLNGQWELLEKVYVNKPVPKGSCDCGAHNTGSEMHSTWCSGVTAPPMNPHTQNNKHFSDLFDEMNKAIINKDHNGIQSARQKVKSFALGLTPGNIDIGHLGKLREQQPKLLDANGKPITRPFTHDDLNDIISYHVGSKDSLKDIYDKNGGADAIETLIRGEGANGSVSPYAQIGLQDRVHDELRDLTHFYKHKWAIQYSGGGKSQYEATPTDPYHDKRVDDTYRDWLDEMRDDIDGNSQATIDAGKKHEDAVVARALERFKRHHGLTKSTSADGWSEWILKKNQELTGGLEKRDYVVLEKANNRRSEFDKPGEKVRAGSLPEGTHQIVKPGSMGITTGKYDPTGNYPNERLSPSDSDSKTNKKKAKKVSAGANKRSTRNKKSKQTKSPPKSPPKCPHCGSGSCGGVAYGMH